MKFEEVKGVLTEEAERLGLDRYEVYYMESSDMSADTLKDEISSFSSGVRGGVCFRCIVDGHMGNASSELFEENEMRALVARALENAKNIESDDKAILFSGSPEYKKTSPPALSDKSAAELKTIALELQKRTYDECELIIDGTQSGTFKSRIKTELINSSGLHLENSAYMYGAYVQSVVKEGEESQEGFDWTLSFDEKELADVSKRATEDALSKIGALEIESGKYDVVISGKKMKDLLSAFSSAFSAKNAQLGMSRLRDKEGERVAADIITLIDDPMREGSPMQTPFDGEGVATYKKTVIEKGTLKTLLYDLATADKAGRESTANGQRVSYQNAVGIAPYSFYIDKGDKSLEGLFAKMKDGIYITEFKGMHAGCNAVTGDFSIESAGFLVEDGKLSKAVKSFTVAGNFFELLCEIDEISDTVHFGIPSGFSCFGSPDVYLKNMSVAGK